MSLGFHQRAGDGSSRLDSVMVRLFKERFVPGVFSRIPLGVLAKITQTRLITPYYHIVSDAEVPHVKHLYKYWGTREFTDHIDFFLKNYSAVTLHDVLDSLNGARDLPQNSFLLTFDDGLAEMYDVVAPILKNKGVPATFFLTTAFLDNKQLCHNHKASLLIEHVNALKDDCLKDPIRAFLTKKGFPGETINTSLLAVGYHQRHTLNQVAHLLNYDFEKYLLTHRPYLTSGQVESLIKDGFTIGAHSIDHPLFSSLSFEEQLRQTRNSIAFIRKRFSLDYAAFAFPYSDKNLSKQFFEEILSAGWIDIFFGTGGMLTDSVSRNFPRFTMEKTSLPAQQIIAKQYARRFYRTLSRTHIVERV